jgi:hypothetical protein
MLKKNQALVAQEEGLLQLGVVDIQPAQIQEPLSFAPSAFTNAGKLKRLLIVFFSIGIVASILK